jgi:pimeloyl-ACP methyl ester carboxylesterase
MASIFSTALFLAALAPKATDVTWLKVPPRATDPQIGETYNSPHYVYVNREIVVERRPQLPRARHQLLLYLTGTGGHWEDAKAFCDLAADLGYHVINLMYPDNIPATVCARDSDPKAFEDFRMAIIQGGQSRHTTIERADSIENRLAKLLMFLRPRRPREDWGQFLNADDAIKWESIAVSGQSQGGGHAALIAIRHRVARVICTGAPKDYSKRPDA